MSASKPVELVLGFNWDGGDNDAVYAPGLLGRNSFFGLASEGRATQQDALTNQIFPSTNEHDQQRSDVQGSGRVVSLRANLKNPMGTSGNDVMSGNYLPDVLMGFGGNDVIDGGSENDTLFGNQGDDTLFGGQAHDELYGGKGSDSLIGGMGSDLLFGNMGDDFLYGDDLNGDEWGDDFIYGGQGNDYLLGGQGNDYLSGDLGDDTLDAWLGDDTLYGGLGNDIFVISSDPGIRTIADFNQGFDKFALVGGLQFSDLSIQSNDGRIELCVDETPVAALGSAVSDLLNPGNFLIWN